MEKEKKKNKLIWWIILIVLILLILGLNYVKFFMKTEEKVNTEKNEPSVKANGNTDDASDSLLTIVDSFNSHSKIASYAANNIFISATLDGNTISARYDDGKTTIFDFQCSDSLLTVSVFDDENTGAKIKVIMEILIESVQKSLGNTEDISNDIQEFLNGTGSYTGLSSKKESDQLIYEINITEKLAKKASE